MSDLNNPVNQTSPQNQCCSADPKQATPVAAPAPQTAASSQAAQPIPAAQPGQKRRNPRKRN